MKPITVEEMIEVDRLMIEEFRISLLQMMENAGRNLKDLALRMLANSQVDQHVVVLVGKGNNGGGGLAAARHLVNAGTTLTIALAAKPGSLGETPELQRLALARMEVPGAESLFDPLEIAESLQSADLVIDAMIGYSLHGAPRDPISRLIRMANDAPAPVLALDIPSGVDGTSGTVYDPAIDAAATLTLAWPKSGLLQAEARKKTGDLYVADISVPEAIYNAVGINTEGLFSSGPVQRVPDTNTQS